jgi:hypothetical protein
MITLPDRSNLALLGVLLTLCPQECRPANNQVWDEADRQVAAHSREKRTLISLDQSAPLQLQSMRTAVRSQRGSHTPSRFHSQTIF